MICAMAPPQEADFRERYTPRSSLRSKKAMLGECVHVLPPSSLGLVVHKVGPPLHPQHHVERALRHTAAATAAVFTPSPISSLGSIRGRL